MRYNASWSCFLAQLCFLTTRSLFFIGKIDPSASLSADEHGAFFDGDVSINGEGMQRDQKRFVTIHAGGQFGNQLYQIFAAFSYSLDNDLNLRLPCLRTIESDGMPHNYDLYYRHLNLNTEPLQNQPVLEYREPEFSYSPIPSIAGYESYDLQLHGYFQSEKYFGHRQKEILETFAPPKAIMASIKAAHPYLVDNAIRTDPNPITYVGLQFRDYRKEQPEGRFHPTMTCEYYKKAVGHFPASAVFMVATNNRTFIEPCLRSFLEPTRYIFLDMNYIYEFFALAMCDAFIIPNSSFGLLASWLSESARRKGREKVVIAPKQWFAPPYDNHAMTRDLYPAGTTIIEF